MGAMAVLDSKLSAPPLLGARRDDRRGLGLARLRGLAFVNDRNRRGQRLLKRETARLIRQPNDAWGLHSPCQNSRRRSEALCRGWIRSDDHPGYRGDCRRLPRNAAPSLRIKTCSSRWPVMITSSRYCTNATAWPWQNHQLATSHKPLGSSGSMRPGR